jgi:hypothetical protein
VGGGSVRHRIDGLPRIAGNRQHGFARVSRLGDRLLGEKCPFVVRQQHDENAVRQQANVASENCGLLTAPKAS